MSARDRSWLWLRGSPLAVCSLHPKDVERGLQAPHLCCDRAQGRVRQQRLAEALQTGVGRTGLPESAPWTKSWQKAGKRWSGCALDFAMRAFAEEDAPTTSVAAVSQAEGLHAEQQPLCSMEEGSPQREPQVTCASTGTGGMRQRESFRKRGMLTGDANREHSRS